MINRLHPGEHFDSADAPGKMIESGNYSKLRTEPCAIKDPSRDKTQEGVHWDNWWSGEVKMEMLTIKKSIDPVAAEGWPLYKADRLAMVRAV